MTFRVEGGAGTPAGAKTRAAGTTNRGRKEPAAEN